MPTILGIILIVLGGLLLFDAALSFVLFHLVVFRKSAWNTDRNNASCLKKTAETEEDRKYIGEWEWAERNGQPVSLLSFDGLRLHASFIPHPGAKRVVILVHGYRGCPQNDFNGRMSWLYENQCSLLLVDQRSSNRSEGKYITFGAKEKHDIRSWTEYVLSKTSLPVYLWGVSMGCSSVLMSLEEKYPKQVRGVIADCGFTSPYAMFREISRKSVKFTPHLTLLFFGIYCLLIPHFSIWKNDTRKSLRNADVPILFFHGLSDDFVSPRFTRENYDACASEKDVLYVKKAGHMGCFKEDNENFKRKVEKLFEKD